MRPAAHVQLGVDAALEVLHRERADPQQCRDLGDAVTGAGQDDDLVLPVGQAAALTPGLPRVVALFPAEQREHRGEAARFGHERGNAGPAGGGNVLFGRIAVGHDDVQVREAVHQRAHPPGHVAQPLPGVKDHNIGPPQFTEGEDAIGFRHPPHHGHIRPDGETGGQGVAKQPSRRLYCHPYRDARMHRYHRCQGSVISAPSSCCVNLESTAIAPLTAGESPFALLADLARAAARRRRRPRRPVRKHYVPVTKLRAVIPAPIT